MNLKNDSENGFLVPMFFINEPMSSEDIKMAKVIFERTFGHAPSAEAMLSFKKYGPFITRDVPIDSEARTVRRSPWPRDREYHAYSLAFGRVLQPHAGFSEFQSARDRKRNASMAADSKSADQSEASIGYNVTPVWSAELRAVFLDIKSGNQANPSMTSKKPVVPLGFTVADLTVENGRNAWGILKGGGDCVNLMDLVVTDEGGLQPKKVRVLSMDDRNNVDFAKQPNFSAFVGKSQVMSGMTSGVPSFRKVEVYVMFGLPISPLFSIDAQDVKLMISMIQSEVNLCFHGVAHVKRLLKVQAPGVEYTTWYLVQCLHAIGKDLFGLAKHADHSITRDFLDRKFSYLNYAMSTALVCMGDSRIATSMARTALSWIQCPGSKFANPSIGNGLKFVRLSMHVITACMCGIPRAALVPSIMTATVCKMVDLIPQQRKPQLWYGGTGKEAAKHHQGIIVKWKLQKDKTFPVLWGVLDSDEKMEVSTALRHLFSMIEGDIMSTIFILNVFDDKKPSDLLRELALNFNQLTVDRKDQVFTKMIELRKQFDVDAKTRAGFGTKLQFIRTALGWKSVDSKASHSPELMFRGFLEMFAKICVNRENMRVAQPIITNEVLAAFDVKEFSYFVKEEIFDVDDTVDPRVTDARRKIDAAERTLRMTAASIDDQMRSDVKVRQLQLIVRDEPSGRTKEIETVYQALIHNCGTPPLPAGATDIPLSGGVGTIECLFPGCGKTFTSTAHCIAHLHEQERIHIAIMRDPEKYGVPPMKTTTFTESLHASRCRYGCWECPVCGMEADAKTHLWDETVTIDGENTPNPCYAGQSNYGRSVYTKANEWRAVELKKTTITASNRVQDAAREIERIRADKTKAADVVSADLRAVIAEQLDVIRSIDSEAVEAEERKQQMAIEAEAKRLATIEAHQADVISRVGAKNKMRADRLLDGNCPVCIEPFKDSGDITADDQPVVAHIIVKCGHLICGDCVSHLEICPLCRGNIDYIMFFRVDHA